MFTEYIFENKKYERAVRDLKSTLFDIVASENSKLSGVEAKADLEINPKRKKELEELCAQQNACLKKVLEISGELSDSLMKLDSYSKELNKLEDENIAEIIANLGEKNIGESYNKEVIVADQEKDDLVRGVNGKDGEFDSEEQEVTEDVQMDMGESGDVEEDTESYEEAEVVDTDGNSDEEEAIDEEEIEPNEAGDVEEDTESYEEAEVVDTDGNSEEEEAIDEEEIEPNEAGDVEEDTESYEEEATDEAEVEVSAEVAGENDTFIQEEVTSEPVIPKVIDTVSVNEGVERSQMVEQPIAEIQQIDDNNPVFVQSASNISDSANIGPIPQVDTASLEPVVAVDIPVVSEIVEKKQDDTFENRTLPVYTKTNTNVTKAILTAKRQIANLRSSKEKMTALYKEGQADTNVGLAKNTDNKINEIKGSNYITNQQLMNNGLLEPTAEEKQLQIEKMMEKANALYKEGKVGEAQVMYEQISMLNKEIQASANAVRK